MKRWVFLTTLALGCVLLPLVGQDTRTPVKLLHAAQACHVEVHAFYIQGTATLPDGQAQAVLRLATQAVREWPAGEARSVALPQANTQRITLAATCLPDAAQAQAISRRMRMLLGEQARIATCLTGRAQTDDLAKLATDALLQLEDAPQEALQAPSLVSMTGERAQVALRADAQGAMVFLACPLIPMDY